MGRRNVPEGGRASERAARLVVLKLDGGHVFVVVVVDAK